MLRREAPKGQHRTQKRTTNHHARQKACPQTQTRTTYPPYSSIGSDHRDIHDEKKTTKAQKVWGGHGQWGNNEKANKYVKNTKEGAKGAHHARIPKHTQGRKVKDNGDKVK